MSYKKAIDLIPADLLAQIQQYVNGGYIYIPKADKSRAEWGSNTVIRAELALRNQNIYEDYLNGMTSPQLAGKYYLSEKSIHRILRDRRKCPAHT